ncbi:MAG: glycosyltransferase, partial [Desulfobacterales bacterium]
MNQRSQRLLIFIVAYNHEKTIDGVLDRIPPAVFEYDYQILIIDDCSSDNTFCVASEFKRLRRDLNIEILCNPENQGYGGNQKLGYQYAIEEGFDAVALLHGDGQYAPELLDELSRPVLNEEAEAVFGTRMAKFWDPLRGGMPVYKFIGNKFLTTLQNLLLRSELSEFHCGYRVYSVKALAEIPFSYNTNDFHFDTEIIIQFLRKGFRIREIPIPTYYGDEICYVNGIKYGGKVIATTLNSRLQEMGIFYHPKYDVSDSKDPYDLKLGYPSSHTLTLEAVRSGARVLDIGCGRGLLAAKLKEKGCYIYGVDSSHPDNTQCLDGFMRLDLNRDSIDFSLDGFDYILLLDIIEHLIKPERLLDELRTKAGAKIPHVIITVPNVAFFLVRFRLLFGGFQYGKAGILDKTHTKFFTVSSIKMLLEQRGYEIVS